MRSESIEVFGAWRGIGSLEAWIEKICCGAVVLAVFPPMILAKVFEGVDSIYELCKKKLLRYAIPLVFRSCPHLLWLHTNIGN